RYVLLEQLVERLGIHLSGLQGPGGTGSQTRDNSQGHDKERRPGAQKRHGWVSFGAALGWKSLPGWKGSRQARCEIDRLGFAFIIPGLFWAMPYRSADR